MTPSATAIALTAQGEPVIYWLKSVKHGYRIKRPRGMKGMVWDYIVDNKLDIINPETGRFSPKKGLKRDLTSGVFYDLRKPLEAAGYDVTSKEAAKHKTRKTIQVAYIKEICDSLEIRRIEIGIMAGETGNLFYRGNQYAVSLDDLGALKNMGFIILIIEKRGIVELLRDALKPYGIAVLSTQGFLTENALDLAYLAEKAGGKVAILTDYDISGIMIGYQVKEVPRIGIDGEKTLEELGILDKKSDLEEAYIPGSSHLKAVKKSIHKFDFDVDLDYLRETRIEIDSVLREVGPERFAEWIMERLRDIFGDEELNYNRSIVMPKSSSFMPDEIMRLYHMMEVRIEETLAPEIISEKRTLRKYIPNGNGGFIEDVEAYEDILRGKWQGLVDDDEKIKPLIADTKKIIKKHGAPPPLS